MKKLIVFVLACLLVSRCFGIITQLDTENADRDITSTITVLTDIPSVEDFLLCQGLIYFGDGAKDLDGNGGNFELTITVGGQTMQASPEVIVFGTEARSAIWTSQFPVPDNAQVILRVKSPNGADTDVDITAYLFDVSIGPAALTAAEVNAELDTALNTVIPASPTKDSVNDIVKTGIIDIIESQRGRHTSQGNRFYVDPVNGATHGSGARGGRADPYLTIQDCHDNAVTAWNHDIIFLIAGDADSLTTHTINGTTTISKAYTFIRGPGRDFIVTRTGVGDTFAVTGDGVEISGMQIGTLDSGNGDGVDVTGADFTRIHHCWFLATQGDGIHILRGDNGYYHDNHFDGTGVGGTGQGIHIVGTGGTSNDNVIHNNHFADTAGDSILIEQGTTNDSAIHHNEIHNSSGWGINIGGSSNDAQVHDNFLANNASGNITDSGTDTVQANNEQWATVDAVWEKDVSGASDTDLTGGILIWLFNLAEGDQFIDITQTPWQAVTNKKGTPATEYLRKNLFNVSGGNVTSIATVIGKQTEP